LNFYYAKSVKKRFRGLACFFLGTNTREMMSVSKIYGVVVWQLLFDDLGDLELSV
jgi:hypothetical protein